LLDEYRTRPSAELLEELTAALTRAGRHDELGELAAVAGLAPEAPGSAGLLAAAAEHLALGDLDAALRTWRTAVAGDPVRAAATEPIAAAALIDPLLVAGRYAAAAATLTAEIDALERLVVAGAGDLARLAARRRTAAQLWQDELGRLDRALENWLRAFELEPTDTEALAAARSIYASLGKDDEVARL